MFLFRVEQSLVIMMGCIPPHRAVTKIQFPKLRSLGESIVRIMGSTHSSRLKSSRLHSKSERSTYQKFELGDSRRQGHKEDTLLHGDKEASATGLYPKEGNLADIRDDREIQRTDTFTVSFDTLAEPKQDV